jgi:hypothetical protein
MAAAWAGALMAASAPGTAPIMADVMAATEKYLELI